MDPAAQRRKNLLIVPCLGDIPGEGSGEGRNCHQIFVVPLSDLSRSDCPELRPKYVVDCRVFGSELCVVGSEIYMFDSLFKSDTEVGAFNLQNHLDRTTTIELRRDMVRYVAPMRSPKNGVKAVPTAGGMVLAFSTRIERIPYCSSTGSNSSKVVDFELYDPKTDSWEEIPPIQQANLDLMADRSFEISAYSFVDDVTFIVETETMGQYRLTIGPHGSGSSYWEVHCFLGGRIPLCGYSRAVVGGVGQLWLTPTIICDRETVGGGSHREVVSKFPMSPFLFDNVFHFGGWSQSIVFEGATSSCCFLLETAQNGFSGQHFLRIDEYHLDMVKYFQDKAALEAMVREPNRPCAPQLQIRLNRSTYFTLSPRHPSSLRLPMLDKPPTII